MNVGKMEETIGLGVDFWNDSCDLRELSEAVERGAVGATSNPVIVATVVKDDAERWIPVLRRLDREQPGLADDALAWKWVDAIAVAASRLLLPVYERTKGAKGFLNVQVNPENARDPAKMIEQAHHLASLAPNIAVKVPLTKEGLVVLEALSAEGIRTNATVSFSVSQALAAAEAMERGMNRRSSLDAFTPYVTVMVGRVADHLKRVQDASMVLADPGTADWGGIAIFKKAYRLFRERGLRPALVAAAYRHKRQWSELIGDGLVQSMPYKWWKAFDASDVALVSSIGQPVPAPIMDELNGLFPDFVRAYDERGMLPEEFEHYGASVATLRQFEAGYRELVEHVRKEREGK
jgi:transaldolase